MQEPYWWYILYTRPGAEQKVIAYIKEAFNKSGASNGFEPFCPESEFYYRAKKGSAHCNEYKKRPLFPGYVFIETDLPQNEFLKKFSSYVYDSPDIIRILHYGASQNIALDDRERQRFEYLLRGKRCFDHSEGYIVGDKIEITTGPLVGLEGLITHINRHNRVARINIDMFGGHIETKVALEIVERK